MTQYHEVEPASVTENAMQLSVRRLQPTIGAEISGVDLAQPLAPALRDAIRAAVIRYKVVFFRDQTLDDAQQLAFAAHFGPLYSLPDPVGAGGAGKLHDIVPANIAQLAAKDAIAGLNDEPWHADTTWRLEPTWGAVLRAVNVPEVGGDTIWVDGHLAYRTLPDELRARVEGRFATHDYTAQLAKLGRNYPIVAHPIVRTHRETGEKILWVNHSLRPEILGLEPAESRAVLNALLEHYKKPEHQVRFSWRPGSVAFWDNRATIHYGVRDYGDFPRRLRRTLIADEPCYQDL